MRDWHVRTPQIFRIFLRISVLPPTQTRARVHSHIDNLAFLVGPLRPLYTYSGCSAHLRAAPQTVRHVMRSHFLSDAFTVCPLHNHTIKLWTRLCATTNGRLLIRVFALIARSHTSEWCGPEKPDPCVQAPIPFTHIRLPRLTSYSNATGSVCFGLCVIANNHTHRSSGTRSPFQIMCVMHYNTRTFVRTHTQTQNKTKKNAPKTWRQRQRRRPTNGHWPHLCVVTSAPVWAAERKLSRTFTAYVHVHMYVCAACCDFASTNAHTTANKPNARTQLFSL